MCEKTDEGEAESIIFILALVLSSSASVKLLITFEGFKPVFLSETCLSLCQHDFESQIVHEKLSNFKFFFFCDFGDIFYSLSRPFPARPLFLIVLHNEVKKDSRDKGVLCNAISERRIYLVIIMY